MRASVLLLLLLLGALARAAPEIALEAAADRKFYRQNARNEIHVAARVTAPAAAGAAARRNLALLLDRSGSMAGAPLAAQRAAALAAIARLAPDDIISVIAFGSEVETVIEAQRRDALTDLEQRLNAIDLAGGAALYDALSQGAALLRRHAQPLSLNQLVLVTDGPPTKGPREAEDFTRLAEALAREGMIVSTIGLGPDFNEDMLAAMARAGHGHFRYAATPAQLAPALAAELAPPAGVLGHDATLTIAFKSFARKPRTHTWRTAAVKDTTLTYAFPRILAGETFTALASVELDSFDTRFDLDDFAVVRLAWTDAAGRPAELVRKVVVTFTSETGEIRDNLDRSVARDAAPLAVRAGLQKAIEAIDKSDPRRALRALRTARTDLRDLNFDLDDAAINELTRRFDTYLAEVGSRPLGPADRKVWRSGLFNQFDPPAALPPPLY